MDVANTLAGRVLTHSSTEGKYRKELLIVIDPLNKLDPSEADATDAFDNALAICDQLEQDGWEIEAAVELDDESFIQIPVDMPDDRKAGQLAQRIFDLLNAKFGDGLVGVTGQLA